MKAVRLKTEYLKSPVGIDVQRPRIFWNCEGGKKQTAYRIVTEKWDSGKVDGDTMRAEYPLTLLSRERVNYTVTLWDENGVEGEPSTDFFEFGLSREDWRAKWITGDYTVRPRTRYPVDCFKKEFTITKNIKKARLYITACGLYQAKLNGKKAGDFCLAPGYTDYNKRVQYQTYDVTDLLENGANAIEIELADGWYRGSIGAWGRRNQFGTETKLLAQLETEFDDGTTETVATDGSWLWSCDGPIRFADNKDGEVVESFRESSYTGHAKVTAHGVVPSASNNVPVTEHEHFSPVITRSPNGRQLLDFGQNIAGYIEFHISAHLGQRMVWRFGEMLDENGDLTQKNFQLVTKRRTTPLQKIEYTCKEGQNDYKTTFAVFGFRYAELESDIEIKPEEVEAIAVYSDMEETGFFDCSSALLNKFFAATKWSAKGNHLDIPTDCPTRERHGWTGDAQIFFVTAAYLFDFAAFSEKYLCDVYDWQKKSGRLPQIAPHGGVDFYMNVMDGSTGWSDIGILYPYRFHKMYGDKAILEKNYGKMKKYASFLISRCGKWGGPYARATGVRGDAKKYIVNCGQSYDEWAEPADVKSFHWTDFAAPHPEVSTAYTSYLMGMMIEIAETLGKTDDLPLYREYRDGCRYAYRELVKTPAYSLDTDRQARLVRPLYMDLLDEKQTEFAKARLINALENYGWRLGTGFLSTPLILDVLTEIDPEAAYRLLENEEIPGWLSMPKNGATTVWEAWEGPDSKKGGIGSLNHYSKGAVCEWMFKTMCGIRIDGENHFTVKPVPGGNFKHAEAKYASIYGKIESGWKRNGGTTVFTVIVPPNCSATVILPDGTAFEQSAGKMTYEVK